MGTSALAVTRADIAERARARRVRVTGAVLFAAIVLWTLITAAASGGRAGSAVALMAATAMTVVVAYTVSAYGRWIVPAVVLAVAVAIAPWADLLGVHPRGGALGYVNATGAFYALAAIAALMLAATARARWLRALGVGAAFACAAVPFVAGSVTAAMLVVFLPVAAMAAMAVRSVRTVVVVVGGLVVVALALGVALGATYAPGSRRGVVDRVVDSTLSERRVALWHEALRLAARHLALGVGPGRFAQESRVAHGDPDAAWAHNEFLQQAAETGALGGFLLLALFGWGLWAAATPSRSDPVAALAAAAVGLACIGACVDYLLHIPAIPLTTAALATTAMHHGSSAYDEGGRDA